jgi:hypothetical protein
VEKFFLSKNKNPYFIPDPRDIDVYVITFVLNFLNVHPFCSEELS